MLDNAEPFHRKIVDLELAEMHRVGVGPQNAQAADGQSPDGKRAHRQGAERKRADRHLSHADRRQLKMPISRTSAR